ncbi:MULTISPECIES: hypothetical protein [unclassified Streptomyces]|uniref:hypothetical protein n=1 Tax=unclassified Streptomyces TaxID=2593676 RepID=UPI002E19D9AC
MRLPTGGNSRWLGIAQYAFGSIIAIYFTLVAIALIDSQFPNALPSLETLIGRLIQLSTDEYVGSFVRDRFLVFALIGVMFLLWVTHKWPTLIKTIGQALNPFARIGVATVSAVAAVLIALILAGPLGQSRSDGECTSSFRLSLSNEPALASNTECSGGGRGRDGD